SPRPKPARPAPRARARPARFLPLEARAPRDKRPSPRRPDCVIIGEMAVTGANAGVNSAGINNAGINNAGVNELKKRIRALGLRVTAPRLAVLQTLAKAGRPLSHAEVVERLGPDTLWDRATVYRNLVALVGVKLLRVASHAGGITRYEVATGEAHDGHP